MGKVVAAAGGAVDPDALARAQRPGMADLAVYHDVVAEVRAELLARVDGAVAAGVGTRRTW